MAVDVGLASREVLRGGLLTCALLLANAIQHLEHGYNVLVVLGDHIDYSPPGLHPLLEHGQPIGVSRAMIFEKPCEVETEKSGDEAEKALVDKYLHEFLLERAHRHLTAGR